MQAAPGRDRHDTLRRLARAARRLLGTGAAVVGAGVLLVGCASVHRQPPGDASTTRVAPTDAPLSAWARDAGTGVHLLASGADALQARLALIEQARTAVDLQVYIFEGDASGTAVADALRRAAARGVRVRLLLDDWGDKPPDAALARLASQPGLAVRLFNPVAVPALPALSLLIEFSRTNRRMHNKLLLVDGQVAVAGGRNVGDAYFARQAEVMFGDLDVLLAGPAVADLARSFDAYWNASGNAAIVPAQDAGASVAPLPAPAPPTPETAAFAALLLDRSLVLQPTAAVVALVDPPGKIDAPAARAASSVASTFAATTGPAERSLLIVSPYFVPGPEGVAWLLGLRQRGVAVRIVTNSLAATDVPAVHAGYARHRRALVAGGVTLHEVRPDAGGPAPHARGPGLGQAVQRSLHAKVLVVDDRWTFVGSMNLDPRSLRLNTESGVAIDSPAVARALSQDVERVLARDTWRVEAAEGRLQWIEGDGPAAVRHAREPAAGWWLRWQATVLSWLPIDALL